MEDKPLSEICSFCDVKLKSHFEYEAHIMGQRHRYEVKREIVREQHLASSRRRPLQLTEYNCRLCYETYLGAVSYFDHLVICHRRKSPCREIEIRVCRLCNIEYRDRISFNQHLGSQYHRQANKRRKEALGYSLHSRANGYSLDSGARGHSSRSHDRGHSSRDRRFPVASSSASYKCHLCDSIHRNEEFLQSHMWSQHPHAL